MPNGQDPLHAFASPSTPLLVLRLEPAIHEALALSEVLTLAIEEPTTHNTLAFIGYELRSRVATIWDAYNKLLDQLPQETAQARPEAVFARKSAAAVISKTRPV